MLGLVLTDLVEDRNSFFDGGRFECLGDLRFFCDGLVERLLQAHGNSGRVVRARRFGGFGGDRRRLRFDGGLDGDRMAPQLEPDVVATTRGNDRESILNARRPLDFVFDRGCFHAFDDENDRARFAQRVAAALNDNGVWLSLIGSTEGAAREEGPPRRSARDVMNAIEPSLEILQFRSTEFSVCEQHLKSWLCLSCTRTVPAQPSTRR